MQQKWELPNFQKVYIKELILEFYKNPENEKRFQEWKQKKESLSTANGNSLTDKDK